MATTKTKATRRGGRAPGDWKHVSQEGIISFRRDNNISRARLAAALGVSSTSIQNWEVGAAIPVLRTQEALAKLIENPSAVDAVPTGAARGGPLVGEALNAIQAAKIQATGTIVAALMQGTRVSATDLPGLIRQVQGALS